MNFHEFLSLFRAFFMMTVKSEMISWSSLRRRRATSRLHHCVSLKDMHSLLMMLVFSMNSFLLLWESFPSSVQEKIINFLLLTFEWFLNVCPPSFFSWLLLLSYHLAKKSRRSSDDDGTTRKGLFMKWSRDKQGIMFESHSSGIKARFNSCFVVCYTLLLCWLLF